MECGNVGSRNVHCELNGAIKQKYRINQLLTIWIILLVILYEIYDDN